MLPIIEKLLAVQEHDRRIARLLREQRDVPLRKQQIESRLLAHRESHKAAQENLKKHTATIKRIEGDIEEKKEQIKKYRDQELQIKSNGEYKALEHEIAMVQQRIRALEDEEIAGMEQVDELQRQQQQHGQDFQVEEKQVQEDLKTLDARAAGIAQEIEQCRAARTAEAQGIDPEWLARYDRVFQRAGDHALVSVDKSCCGGCHMQLPPSVVHDARKALSITLCNYCGRMLYVNA